jgi:hypothetical protein
LSSTCLACQLNASMGRRINRCDENSDCAKGGGNSQLDRDAGMKSAADKIQLTVPANIASKDVWRYQQVWGQ